MDASSSHGALGLLYFIKSVIHLLYTRLCLLDLLVKIVKESVLVRVFSLVFRPSPTTCVDHSGELFKGFRASRGSLIQVLVCVQSAT